MSHSLTKEDPLFVDKTELLTLLEKRLQVCIESQTPIDTITFAGNGEPTLHPAFLFIVKEVVDLRNRYFPSAKIAVLTNGVTLKNKRIREALKRVDKAIVKLDAGDDSTINLLDQPRRKLSISKLMEAMATFDGELIIQTMFLKGTLEGRSIDNSQGKVLEYWLEKIKAIRPTEVMLYSIDRDTPIQTLERVPKEELEIIARQVKDLGIKTQVV